MKIIVENLSFKIIFKRLSGEDDILFRSKQKVQSQMTDVPDNRRPRWPNFEQSEEVYNITVFF